MSGGDKTVFLVGDDFPERNPEEASGILDQHGNPLSPFEPVPNEWDDRPRLRPGDPGYEPEQKIFERAIPVASSMAPTDAIPSSTRSVQRAPKKRFVVPYGRTILCLLFAAGLGGVWAYSRSFNNTENAAGANVLPPTNVGTVATAVAHLITTNTGDQCTPGKMVQVRSDLTSDARVRSGATLNGDIRYLAPANVFFTSLGCIEGDPVDGDKVWVFVQPNAKSQGIYVENAVTKKHEAVPDALLSESSVIHQSLVTPTK
jgi:hypothetical protein